LKIKLGEYIDALEDCATVQPINSPKVHRLRGIALYSLDEFESALDAFNAAIGATSSSSSKKEEEELHEWVAKCSAKCSANGLPSSSTCALPAPSSSTVLSFPPFSPCEANVADVDASKYRHQWYQTPTHVYVSVFAKKLPTSRVSLDVSRTTCRIQIRDEETGTQVEYQLFLHLWGPVDTQDVVPECFNPKFEVKLRKADGSNWAELQRSGAPEQEAKQEALPRPWASSKKPMDWDKLEAEVKAAEKDEKLDGEVGFQKFLKDLYGDSNEDQRRAMMKSYVESNGTVLSTNWAEIGQKKTEWRAPDGMEAKQREF